MMDAVQLTELGTVQQKIKCVFQTKVIEQPSAKRNSQPYRVVAQPEIRQAAVESGIENSWPSEKMDGTCVYISNYEGKPWLWARHDRKLNKNAERKFRKHQNEVYAWQAGGKITVEPEPFKWEASYFKDVPAEWVAADGVQRIDGMDQPDDNGHTPGWVPVDPASRQHLWHLGAVDLTANICLILKPEDKDCNRFELTLEPLGNYVGKTLELIGTHVNANPYGIGCKKLPLHVLVVHGSIPFTERPPLGFTELAEFVSNVDKQGGVEGIVWHCRDKSLYKLHCHHLNLKWPPKDVEPSKLKLNSVPVIVSCNLMENEVDYKENSTFQWLQHLDGTVLPALCFVKP